MRRAMTVGAHPPHSPRHRTRLSDPALRVALVAATCLLGEAIIAKNVLNVKLDYFSQFAALWIFTAYFAAGLRDRTATLATMLASVLATVAVLLLYAP